MHLFSQCIILKTIIFFISVYFFVRSNLTHIQTKVETTRLTTIDTWSQIFETFELYVDVLRF